MNRVALAFAARAVLVAASSVAAGRGQGEQVVMEKRGVAMPVLSAGEFARLRERDQTIPTDGETVLSLTNLLLGKDGGSAARTFIVETMDGEDDEASKVVCGEHLYGKLFTALQNPDLDEGVRNQAAADLDAAVPLLDDTLTIGHFRFHFTTSDDDPNASHAVTPEEVKATATVLNDAWDDFAANFCEPKHIDVGGEKIIDVRIYDLPTPGLYGVTASMWDHIELDSVLVVSDECKRQTTPPHELFHRVQYSYGYQSGSEKMKWAVEATAAWSQKHRAKHVGDYKTRVKFGLENPDVALLDRSYDAAHFWIYMGQQAGGEKEFVRDCWEGFQNAGMLEPVRAVAMAKVGHNLETCIANWHYASVRKDVSPLAPKYGYEEDEDSVSCGGTVYGPLRRVVTETHVLNPANPPQVSPGTVSLFGADHHRYIIPAGGSTIKLTVTPADGEAVMCGCTAINGEALVDEATPTAANPYVYERNFGDNPVTDVFLTIVGAPAAADYTVTAEMPDATDGN